MPRREQKAPCCSGGATRPQQTGARLRVSLEKGDPALKPRSSRAVWSFWEDGWGGAGPCVCGFHLLCDRSTAGDLESQLEGICRVICSLGLRGLRPWAEASNLTLCLCPPCEPLSCQAAPQDLHCEVSSSTSAPRPRPRPRPRASPLNLVDQSFLSKTLLLKLMSSCLL